MKTVIIMVASIAFAAIVGGVIRPYENEIGEDIPFFARWCINMIIGAAIAVIVAVIFLIVTSPQIVTETYQLTNFSNGDFVRTYNSDYYFKTNDSEIEKAPGTYVKVAYTSEEAPSIKITTNHRSLLGNDMDYENGYVLYLPDGIGVRDISNDGEAIKEIASTEKNIFNQMVTELHGTITEYH